jgi:hypothetical protein
MNVRADIVNNTGPNTVESVFRELARSARTLQAVVAFATKAGVDAVLPHIRRIAERGRVSITVGLYQGVTEPAALRALARAAKTLDGRLTVRIARLPNLHRKVYVFGLAQRTAVLVGSSNLTSEGLSSDGEFNVLLHLPGRYPNLLRYLPELAQGSKATVPLTRQLISEYEHSRHRPKPAARKGDLYRLLKVESGHSKALPPPPRDIHWLRCALVGTVRRRTMEVISQQTNWDRRGWCWCTTDREDRVSEGDNILLFDYRNKVAWAQIVTVKGVTRTWVPTPDGRCFLAYAASRRRFRKRKVTKVFWRDLADAGWKLTKQKSKGVRRLSGRAITAVERVFKR